MTAAPASGAGARSGAGRLFREAALIAAARVGGALSALVFTMMLSRAMGAAALGEVAAAIALAMLLGLACTTNIEAGGVRFMVRDLAEGRPDKALGYIRFTRRYVLGLSLLAVPAAVLVMTLANGALPGTPVLLAVCAAPLVAAMRLGAGAAMGFSNPLLAVLPRTLFRPLLLLLAVGLLLLAGQTITPAGVIAVFIATLACVAAGQQLVLNRSIRLLRQQAAGPDSRDWPLWLRVSLMLGLNVLFVEYSVYVAVLSASFVLPPDQLALFDVTLKIMALLKFGLTAVNQVFLPRLSQAMAAGNRPALLRWLAVSGLMKSAALAVGIAVVVLAGRWGLGLFGAPFAAAYPVLLLVMLDPVLVAVLGPGANVVSFSNRPAALLPALAAALLVLVAGCLALGSWGGLWGAGLAVVLARLVWTLWLTLYSRRVLGIDPTLLSAARWMKLRKAGA